MKQNYNIFFKIFKQFFPVRTVIFSGYIIVHTVVGDINGWNSYTTDGTIDGYQICDPGLTPIFLQAEFYSCERQRHRLIHLPRLIAGKRHRRLIF